MKTRNFFILTTISLFIGFLIGVVFGVLIPKDNVYKEKVTEETVSKKISEISFFVSDRIIYDQENIIFIDYNSNWPSRFWSKEITITGEVRAELGIDLRETDPDDIFINHDEKTIYINLQNPKLKSLTVRGPIYIYDNSKENEIITRTDSPEIYDVAAKELIKGLENQIDLDNGLLETASHQTVQFLQITFIDTGYSISTK